jgi:hypothetical protein
MQLIGLYSSADVAPERHESDRLAVNFGSQRAPERETPRVQLLGKQHKSNRVAPLARFARESPLRFDR